MVDTHRRHLQRPGQRAGHARTHQQGADQAGARGVGHALDVAHAQAGLGQGLAHQRQQLAHVVTAGQLGHHTTVFGVQGDLAVDRMGAQGRAAGQVGVIHRHAGLITGRFDAKDSHACYYDAPAASSGDAQVSLLSNLWPVFRVGRLQFVVSPL
ncbi:hypothetical protein G6F31_018991 [Rhizopus arrhizus]|nr:hypothetical protein G6F31_018991 [Rhizopus arrhizus]